MTTGSVIVLNGVSSSGKTTLATTMQRQLAADNECWFIYAIDDYFSKVPFDWVTGGKHVGVHADEGVALEHVDGVFRMRMGPIGRQVLVAWRGAVGSAARAGLNVIADNVVLTEEEWQGWQAELDGLDVHWVRVHIDLDVVEAREAARGNRMLGHVRAAVRRRLPLPHLRRRGRHRHPRPGGRGRRRHHRLARPPRAAVPMCPFVPPRMGCTIGHPWAAGIAGLLADCFMGGQTATKTGAGDRSAPIGTRCHLRLLGSCGTGEPCRRSTR